ncbi:LRR domain containing protein [Trema orientale]|uniref:LRR domain containing protein n=1 Tax=Trema orientale TaxID=63057 RepID=A0A2P5FA19_TREOI|nr:LRR domain containing protein [Trema orientale]
MAKFNCFSVIGGWKKKISKDNEESSKAVDFNQALSTLQIRLQQPVKPFETDEVKSTTFGVSLPLGIDKNSEYNINVISHATPVGCEAAEVAYEGEDEHEENSSIKRNFSDFDLKVHETNSAEELKIGFSKAFDTESIEQSDKVVEKDGERDVDLMQSGHVSDPGIKTEEFWASPNLKRSCSNLETSVVIRKIADQLPPPSKSQSFEQLHELAERMRKDMSPGSPKSVLSHGSADRVMLKKHSSSQVLPSRSRRLWWKLFLWSHRNLHKPWTPKQQAVSAVLNRQGGYSSDTLEPNRGVEFGHMESPGSFTGESLIKGQPISENDKQSWDGFHTGVSGLWPQNQWLAFPTESSPFARVEEWVKHLEPHPSLRINECDNNDEEEIVFPPETPTSQARFPSHSTRRSDINISEEILHANSVIQSLNSSSTVAHIAGIGLKAIPTISCFSSLRSVNLSSNFIVHITPGSLPKGLHTLNLSRNKISTIEGLRELTRLRVLDLSYNRISRIGHGLSNCQLIKELYLAGNKISDVEGLHRLLKLTVLDLSFNKITTTKALGQLVANYNSLQAINLLGNPIQNNISEDQLRKAVCGLLPKLVYLSKQPIKPQRAREVLTDSVAKAALGNGGYSSRRKAGKRISQGGSSGAAHRASASIAAQKTRHRTKSRTHQQTSLMKASPAIASSSR